MLDQQGTSAIGIYKSAAVEQYNLLMQHLPRIIGASTITYCILVYYLSTKTESTLVFLLLGLFFILSTFRTLSYLNHRRVPLNVENLKTRQNLMAFYSLASGSMWGALSLLGISPDDPVTGLFTIMVLTGMVASATASLSHVPKLFALFVLPTMLPAAIKYSTLETNPSIWVSILIVLYLLVSYRFSKDIMKSTLQGITLKFENSDLVENLTSEKLRAESALKQAEQSNLAKSKFLAAASHDLRQPLHALRLFTATLESQNKDNENSSLASNIGKSVTALEGLFEALLDISKLDAGIVKQKEQDFNLQAMLDRLSTGYREQASEKGIVFSAEYSQHFVYTDPILLERVIDNLVINAIRYTDSGTVSVADRASEASVIISIIDTGRGIPEDKQTEVFEEFVQLTNPERDRSKGLGLGLSIVKRITELLNINFTLTSNPGTGTTVELAIPLGNAVYPHSSDDELSPSEQHLGALFVVVIDDEEQARLAMTLLLEQWGCTVLSTADVQEALIALEEYEYEPDAIITDYRLRENQTGIEAIEAIRSHLDMNIDAIIVTGDVERTKLIDINEHGFTSFNKPCDPVQLRTFLAQCTNL